MLKQFGPMVFETGVMLVREAVISYGRKAIAERLAPPPSVVGESTKPQDTGCPYCATAKHLAVAHMYLVRFASVSPSLQAIYHKLAQGALNDAMSDLDSIRVHPDDDTMRLTVEVSRLAGLAESPMSTSSVGAIANDVWRGCGSALRLAERFNTEPDAADAVIRDIDARLHEMDNGVVIDGDAKVVA